MQEVTLPPQRAGASCFLHLKSCDDTRKSVYAAIRGLPHAKKEGIEKEFSLRDHQCGNVDRSEDCSPVTCPIKLAAIAARHTLLRRKGRRTNPKILNDSLFNPSLVAKTYDLCTCPGNSHPTDSSACYSSHFPTAPLSPNIDGWRLSGGRLMRLWLKHSSMNKISTLLQHRELMHPFIALQILGIPDFAEVSLASFLPLLVLHRLLSPSGTSGVPRFRVPLAADGAESFAESFPVHVTHVEGAVFHVSVAASQPSPIQSLLKVWKSGCVDDANGLEFFLTLLIEGVTSATDAGRPLSKDGVLLQEPKHSTEWGSSELRAGAQTIHQGRPRTDEGGLHSRKILTETGIGSRGFTISHPPLPSDDAVTFEGARTTWGRGRFRGELEATATDAACSLTAPDGVDAACQGTEAWKRYCTATALYFAMTDAGVCEGNGLPFLAVQRVCWGDLLAEPTVKAQLRRSGRTRRDALATAMLRRLQESPEEQILAAVTLPIPLKGKVRDSPVALSREKFFEKEGHSASPVACSHQPFTDAEVFQLFYIQLVFRAFLDIRFPSLGCGCGATTCSGARGSCAFRRFRPDRIGTHYHAKQGVAFEHPEISDLWLLFPEGSRTLMFLDMERAVIPLYATSQQLEETAQLPLFGAMSGILCVTKFGNSIVAWAATKSVDSPRAAAAVLCELFDEFGTKYGCCRDKVWRAPVPPRIYRCSAKTLVRMRQTNCHLSQFFVQEHVHGEATRSSCGANSLASGPLGQPPGFQTSGKINLGIVSAEFQAPLALPLTADKNFVPVSSSVGRQVELSDYPNKQISTQAVDFSVKSSGVNEPILTPSDRNASGKDVETSSGGVFYESQYSATIRSPISTFITQESVVSRCRRYACEGCISIFYGPTSDIQISKQLGKGGSSVVYRGFYRRQGLPVAIKVFVIPSGMSHEAYVRESLTDVIFFALANQLEDHGIVKMCRMHDFVVSEVPPEGLGVDDLRVACHGSDPRSTKLCYLVMDLMDGTLGRFLNEQDDNYDPLYDMLENSPMRDGELFQFLYTQLVMKYTLDWKVLDVMLNGQLRGDNIGFRYVSMPKGNPSDLPGCIYYQGILVSYQMFLQGETRYLRFPADLEAETGPVSDPLRFIFFIDVGQGIQANAAELVRKNFIGESVLSSCVEDDGFGRYWPVNELYCRYVVVNDVLSEEVVAWGSSLRINSKADAFKALSELFDLYYPKYGVDKPTEETLRTHVLYEWNAEAIANLCSSHIFLPDVVASVCDTCKIELMC